MQGINRVTIVGHLGKDPEGAALPSGTVVSNFTIATGKKWRDKQSGEQKEHTEWHRIAAFGRLAEVCNQWLKKGAPVYLEGELRTRKWEKEGQTHYTTEIIANEMRMLGGNRPDKDDAGEAAPPPQAPPPARQRATELPFEDDIDIPF